MLCMMLFLFTSTGMKREALSLKAVRIVDGPRGAKDCVSESESFLLVGWTVWSGSIAASPIQDQLRSWYVKTA
jgi:hypothetical protein